MSERKRKKEGKKEERKEGRRKERVVMEMCLTASRQAMLQNFICKSVSNSLHLYPCG